MDQEERRQFWDVLCSLQGTDVQSESEELSKIITLPRYLYRYRAVSVSSIDALQRNHMFFSNAHYYDDPFDTLIHIDFDRIRDEGRKYLSSDQIRQQIHNLSEASIVDPRITDSLLAILDNTDHEKIIDTATDYLKQNIQSLLKETLWTACFTESGDNETMWLKYADQYKGFCLVYDLQDSLRDLCGKQEKCSNCVVNNTGVSIYPVYYSDEGYDATEYAKNLAAVLIAQLVLKNSPISAEVLNAFIPSVQGQMWQPERIALIKSRCHEYDQEWRMLLRGNSKPPVMKEWIPSGVILGLKVTDQNRDIIIRASKMAGVDHIYESFINDKYKIDHREIML